MNKRSDDTFKMRKQSELSSSPPQNCSVALKMGQGHLTTYECVHLDRGYHHAVSHFAKITSKKTPTLNTKFEFN